MIQKPRARALGLPFNGTTGKYNAITDVEGVKVGFSTLNDPKKNMKTGVTAILPIDERDHPSQILAGQFSLNGNGEMTGTHWINDAGYFMGPICISNTHAVGMVHHGCTQWMIKNYAEYFQNEHAWAMPVVAETYDGVLNDINAQHVTAEHAIEAISNASDGPVAEGSVGGGNGMIAYEFKGGTGTSSRVVKLSGETYTVAALVQANHGIREWLNVLGMPVGKAMKNDLLMSRETGSVIVILATDAPLSPLLLRQLAKRAAIGIGRAGTPGGNNSGDIFLAFSTANKQPIPKASTAVISMQQLNQDLIDPLYQAAVEAVDESVINALVAGTDAVTFKPTGHTCKAIDTDKLVELVTKSHRC